ncbi:hypothetical protein K432DRAFT_384556 [Lepidopterella palustris CBS 459.81]|uniref:Uncharacterized protein n=1 Tax=Lepidopterella palustris CBS 459.81 TaxID=1314670 RepID=A0A8E2E587_9PEZI|nr:hypothetical protein K432DRAFT_384556 [Lepidopterella palustris CBS 459.81]
MHGGDAHYSRDDVSPRRLQDHGYYQDPKPFHPRNPHSPPDPPYYESRTSNRYTLDIDYASTLSRSPSPSRGRPRQRGYSTPLPSPPPPPPPPPPGWEWNSHPEPRSMPWDDTTESGDSDETRELVDVRGYRGLDENGRPATFIEERRTVTMPDRTREERPAAGGWKDV